MVIDVLRHSGGQVDWQLTELNYTYSKIPTILLEITRNTEIESCGGLRRPAVIGRTGIILAFWSRISWQPTKVYWKKIVLPAVLQNTARRTLRAPHDTMAMSNLRNAKRETAKG